MVLYKGNPANAGAVKLSRAPVTDGKAEITYATTQNGLPIGKITDLYVQYGGSGDLNSSTVHLTAITLAKADPTVSQWPTAAGITYGALLENSTLTGGTASVPGTFAWATPATQPEVGTAKTYPVTFTPSDAIHYNAVQSELAVAVARVQIVKPTLAGTPYTYTGAEQTVALTGFDDVTMAINGNTQTNAGAYTATITLQDTTHNEWADGATDAVTLPWSIAAKPLENAMLGAVDGQTYSDGKEIKPTPTVSFMAGDTTTTLTPGTDFTFTYADNINAGTATITITAKSANYSGSAGTAFTINRAKGDFTGPTAQAITYGTPLSGAALTGGSTNGSFAWVEPTLIPDAATLATYPARFTPYDTANYDYSGLTSWDDKTKTITFETGVRVNRADHAPVVYTQYIRVGAQRTGTLTLADLFGGAANVPADAVSPNYCPGGVTPAPPDGTAQQHYPGRQPKPALWRESDRHQQRRVYPVPERGGGWPRRGRRQRERPPGQHHCHPERRVP